MYGANRDEPLWRPRIWPGWLTESTLPSGDRVTVWTCDGVDEKSAISPNTDRPCDHKFVISHRIAALVGLLQRLIVTANAVIDAPSASPEPLALDALVDLQEAIAAAEMALSHEAPQYATDAEAHASAERMIRKRRGLLKRLADR